MKESYDDLKVKYNNLIGIERVTSNRYRNKCKEVRRLRFGINLLYKNIVSIRNESFNPSVYDSVLSEFNSIANVYFRK